MSATKGLVALGLTVSMGVGAGLALHEVGKVTQEADLINNCFDHNISSLDKMCYDQPVTTGEANNLYDNAWRFGQIGWLAAAGAAMGFGETIYLISRKEEP